MSSEETDTEDSGSPLSEVSSLGDDFDKMGLGSGSSDEEAIDEEVDSETWNEVESDSDAEFLEDHGLVEEVTSASEDSSITPIDCYRHFITDEVIDLMVHETNRYAEQYLRSHQISRRSKFRQWTPTNDKEMLKFFGVVIEMGLVQMPKLTYYWSSSKLYGSEIIRSVMSRERFELLLKFWHFANNDEMHSSQDSLSKLRPLLHLLKARFSSVYTPGAVITIDETMMPW